MRRKHLPPGLRDTADNLKSSARIPVWMFTGLIILGCLIVAIMYGSWRHDVKVAKLVQAPQSGDLYQVRAADRQYTIFKIADVVGDSVFVLPGEYSSNRVSGLYKIIAMHDTAFSDEQAAFSKAALKAMQESGDIVDVVRPVF